MTARRPARLVALVALAGLPLAAHAQPIAWNAGNGSWNTPANWLPMNVPDTATEIAVLGGVTGYSVDMNFSPFILGVEITNPLAVLSLNSARTLTLLGPSVNNGIVNFNPQNSSTNAVLTVDTNPVLLSGTGEFRMLAGSENSLIQSFNGGSLTNGLGHVIRGVGNIRAITTNLGTISADASIALSGTDLLLSVDNKSNSGVMRAAPGSSLTFSGIGVTQTGAGQIRPDGGTVNFTAMSLTGGQIVGASTFNATGSSTFTDVTLNASGNINSAVTLTIAGDGLTNHANLSVNPQNSSSNAVLRFNDSGDLDGTGEVRLLTGAENSQVTTAVGATITHGADHTIRGVGQIFSTLVNNGEVWADASIALSGVELGLQTNPITNNSTMGARSGSTLAAGAIPLNQGGGGELMADGGTITFASTGLTAGSIEATGSGSWVNLTGTSTFTSVTANAPGQINAATTLAVAGTGLTNNATISINPQNSSSNAHLRFDAAGTLGGTGEVRMLTGNDNSQVNAPGVTITHAGTHTIRGVGQINAAMDNQGTIIADAAIALSGTDLTLQGNDKSSTGLIRADSGASITVNGITLDQTGGGELRVNGGTINFGSAALEGGQITSAGAGNWAVTIGTNTFDSVISSAPGQINAATQLFVTGSGLVNDADININPQLSSSNAVLTFNESGPLGGSGRLILNGGSDNSQLNAAAGASINHAATHALHGEGMVNVAAGSVFDNQGLISPGPVAGGVGAMTFNGVAGSSFDHKGLLAIEIAGNGTGGADRLTGTGRHTLGGTLDLDLIGGYVPARQHNARIIAGTSVTDRFDTINKPALPAGVALRVVYLSNAVEVWFHCPPDFTTGAIPGQAGYGIPNGVLNNDDFFFYLSIFAAGDPDADLTTGAIPGQPGYGTPNGVINNDDFFYYLGIFAAGCQ